MASRVAARIRAETDAEVQLVSGRFGEFTVYLDGRKVIDMNRLWYPRPGKVVEQIKALLP